MVSGTTEHFPMSGCHIQELGDCNHDFNIESVLDIVACLENVSWTSDDLPVYWSVANRNLIHVNKIMMTPIEHLRQELQRSICSLMMKYLYSEQAQTYLTSWETNIPKPMELLIFKLICKFSCIDKSELNVQVWGRVDISMWIYLSKSLLFNERTLSIYCWGVSEWSLTHTNAKIIQQRNNVSTH